MSLESPKFSVKLNGKKSYTIQVATADLIEWELYQCSQPNVPADISLVSNLWSAFVTWSASKRAGKIDADMPFAAYRTDVESLDFQGQTDVDPTKTEAAPGS